MLIAALVLNKRLWSTPVLECQMMRVAIHDHLASVDDCDFSVLTRPVPDRRADRKCVLV